MDTLVRLRDRFLRLTRGSFPTSGAPPWYLVGGALRDALLGIESADFDLITPGDPTALAGEISARLGGNFFFLDEPRRQSRVLFRHRGSRYQLDFAPFRAPSLERDLRLRDFTLNAMALDAASPTPVHIDPCGGAADLRSGILRQCAPGAFAEDPLRLLRAARFCLLHGLRLEERTLEQARRDALRLPAVASERIRAEFILMLRNRGPAAIASALHGLHLLQALWDCRSPVDVTELAAPLASFESRFEEAWAELQAAGMESEFQQELEFGLRRRDALGLAALCMVISRWSPLPARLPAVFSNRTTGFFEALLQSGPAILDSLRQVADMAESRALFVRTLGPFGSARLLFALIRSADPIAGHPAFRALEDELHFRASGGPEPLLDPRALMGMGVSGRRIGELLEELDLARIRGEVHNGQEAQSWLLSRLRESR